MCCVFTCNLCGRYDEGVILQVDLDRDPRYEALHDDVAYVKVDALVSSPGGKVDGAALETLLKGGV